MKYLSVFALALLAGSTAQAQDVRFGVQATVSKPMGDVGNQDWMDSKVGLGIGIQAVINLGNGMAVVPRIDYVTYKNDQTIDALVNRDSKVNILSGGADFQYYFGREVSEGFYVLGGLGYARGTFDNSYTTNSLSLSGSGSQGSIYAQGGFGIHFNRKIGAELRYQSIQFNDVETTLLGVRSRQDVSCPSLQASLVWRF